MIAGTLRSRLLKTLQGSATRPTSDRLRKTLFDLLQPRSMGSRFLDCFAGSGSVGIEAISRGAESVAFIESARRACQILRQNLESLDLGPSGQWRVIESTVQSGLKILQQAGLKFDIVFLDPPYASASEYPIVLAALQQNGILDDEALIIAEHSKHVKVPPAIDDLTRTRQVRQGDSVLSIYRLA